MNLININEPYNSFNEGFPFFLQNYKPIWGGSVETAESINIDDLINSNRGYYNTPLLKIQNDVKEYITAKPICIKVYKDGDLYFAENENLAVCGTGINQEEAIQDLCQHIIHFYEYYKNISVDKLIGEAVRLKNIYKNLFIVN